MCEPLFTILFFTAKRGRSRVGRDLEKYKTRLLLPQVMSTTSYASVLQDADRPSSKQTVKGVEVGKVQKLNKYAPCLSAASLPLETCCISQTCAVIPPDNVLVKEVVKERSLRASVCTTIVLNSITNALVLLIFHARWKYVFLPYERFVLC